MHRYWIKLHKIAWNLGEKINSSHFKLIEKDFFSFFRIRFYLRILSNLESSDNTSSNSTSHCGDERNKFRDFNWKEKTVKIFD